MTKLSIPKGWYAAGSRPNDYDMGVDLDVRCKDMRSAFVHAKSDGADGFGTLMQNCKADAFIGKRVRFSARIRTEDVASWAGIWFRVDGVRTERSLAFDNMQDRVLKGTNDWTTCACVLDVPDVARSLAFGVMLCGLGRLWVSDLRMEPVGLDVPTTTMDTGCSMAEAPTNLDFTA